MKHEEHRSPDGALTLVVSHEDDDITIGFDGFQWHTHGDVLAATYQLAGATDLTPEGATQRFVEDIVSNHAIIAVVKSGKRIRDVWVTDDVLSVKSRLGSRKLLIVNELRHGRSAVGVVIVSLLSFPLAETIPVEAIS